jgi:hypothetical protein
VVLLDLTGELRRLCFNLVTTAARQRRRLGSFGRQNDCRGVYIGETPSVLRKDSLTSWAMVGLAGERKVGHVGNSAQKG